MKNTGNINRPLHEREQQILRAIVYDYITTGKPVGSRSFVQKYSLSISPATIRNIMADLESMEYLKQPYTSAGRTPTDKGYRFYVDTLLDSYEFSFSDEIKTKQDFFKREVQLDKIFASITKMLSMTSKLAGVMLTPKPDFAVIKRIELIQMASNEVLVILVTRTGMILTKKVILSEHLMKENLYDFSKFLTSELCGFSIQDIKTNKFNKLRNDSEQIFDQGIAIDILELAFSENEESELHLDGLENLLKIPEMVDEERINSLLKIIEEKNILRAILEKTLQKEGVRILIGEEIENNSVTGCSMVTTTYKIGNKNVGVIGVIGPTRMDYEKAVPLVDYTGRVVSEFLTNMSK